VIHGKADFRLATRQHWWLTALALAALVVFFIFIMLPTKNTLQIIANKPGFKLPDGFAVYQDLDEQKIRIKSITYENDALVISFESTEYQQQAMEVMQSILPIGYDIVPSQSESLFEFYAR